MTLAAIMTRLSLSILLPFVVVLGFLPTPMLALQNSTQVFPRPEYYVARDLLRDGRTDKANDAFRIALRPFRLPVEQRGLESIASMVMLGECYYHQGDLATALDLYESALLVSIRSPAWLGRLKPLPNGAEKFDATPKTGNWLTSQRKTKLANIPRLWQIASGPAGIAILPGGERPPAGTLFSLDAIEILRAQAIALHRRWEILGPLASETPLTREIQQGFALTFQQLDPALLAGLATCQALADLPIEPRDKIIAKLQNVITLAGSLDHPLTPINLMVQGELAAQQGALPLALTLYGETTLAAAHWDQLDLIADAATRWSAIANSTKNASTLTTLQQLDTWAQTRSLLVRCAALSGIAEHQISIGEVQSAQATLRGLTVVLEPNDVVLPTYSSLGYWMAARIDFSANRVVQGNEFLNQALDKLEHNESSMSSCKKSFRLQLMEKMVKAGDWNATMIPKLMPILLADDGNSWLFDPVESLHYASFDKTSIIQVWLDTEVKVGEATQVALAVDALQRQRFFKSAPLGGRLTSVRRLYLTPTNRLSPEAGANARAWVGLFPEIEKEVANLRAIETRVRAAKPALDMKAWNEDEKKTAEGLVGTSSYLESLFWYAATSRYSLTIAFPRPLDIPNLKQMVANREGLLAFFRSGGAYHGLFAHGEIMEHWKIGQFGEIHQRMLSLFEEMGVASTTPLTNEVLSKQPWDATLNQLGPLMVPPKIAKEIERLERIHVVPDGAFWYFPFEMLPRHESKESESWLTTHPIACWPTLGQALPIATPKVHANRTLAISVPGFFVDSEAIDATMRDQVVQAVPSVEIRTNQQGAKWQGSRWSRMRADRVWVAGRLPMAEIPNLAPFGLDAGLDDGTLSSWLMTPYATPRELALLGLETPLGIGQLGDGSELFMLACTLQATGNQSALVSRWVVRGESSSQLLTSYMSLLPEEPASSAWQRSVLQLWEQRIPISNEPVLGLRNSDKLTVPGSLPLLWSGYMQIGDTN